MRVGKPRTYRKQSISLRLDQMAAALQIAEEEGHRNLSRVIQDAVETELRRRYGRDWARDFQPESTPVAEGVAA